MLNASSDADKKPQRARGKGARTAQGSSHASTATANKAPQPPAVQPPAKPSGTTKASAAKSGPWGPLGAVGMAIVLFVGAQLLASLPFVFYPLARHWTIAQANDWINTTYAQFAYVALASGLTVLGVWWLLRMRSQTFRDIGWTRKFRFEYIIYALAGFAVYFLGFGILRVIAGVLIPGLDVNQQQDIGFNNVLGPPQLIVTFISLVVLPPLAEETLFRGFLYTAFRRKYGMWLSIACVSVLFALPHLSGSKQGAGPLWVGAIDTFTLSVILCYVREKTGNLWTSILIHAIKNALAFTVVYIFHVQ